MARAYKNVSCLVVLALSLVASSYAQNQAPSPFAAAEEFGLSEEEAQQLLDGFFEGGDGPADPFSREDKSEFGLAPKFNESGRLQYYGIGTVGYQMSPISSSGAVNLACGFGYVDPSFQAAYVGIGASFYNRGFSCGRCVKIQCDDISCEEPGRQAVAQVVDNCGECFDADMTVANPLFTELTGRQPNVNPSVTLSWEFIDCSPYINTTIKMLVKPGGSAYYQGFNFANSRYVITAAQINGQRLKHESDNYWSWSPTGGPIDPRGPFSIALLGENRQVLRVRIGQLRSQDLKVQFASSVPLANDEKTDKKKPSKAKNETKGDAVDEVPRPTASEGP